MKTPPGKGIRLASAIVALPLVAMFSPCQAHRQTAVQAWVKRHNAPGNGEDRATAVAVDASGNVFVTGSSAGDYLTIKYSGEGVSLWTNPYNGPSNTTDYASGVAVDGSGNVFVTGSSNGELDGPNDSKYYDYATIAYSGAGVPLWTNHYNGPTNYNDYASAVAVDSSGNVFVTGESETDGSSGYSDYTTIAYSGAGVALWTNRYHGPGNYYDSASAVAVDGSGNILVTGSSYGSGGNYDYATIKYSGAGVPLWTNRYAGLGNSDDSATTVAVDGSANVFVTGSSYGVVYSDFVTIKYSGAGVPLWTNRYNGPANGYAFARALAVDGSGNVFVTGFSRSTAGIESGDFATIKYSGAGVPLWTNRYDGPGNDNDVASAVALDGSGNVYVTGYSASTNIFPNNYGYATIKYSSAGVPLWTNRFNTPGNFNDQASAMVVDGSGNVFVTGSSSDGTTYDYATIKYVEVWPIALRSATLTNGVFNSSFTNTPGAPFTLLTTTNLSLPSSNWTVLGGITESTPGLFTFTDPQTTNHPQRFYGVRSP